MDEKTNRVRRRKRVTGGVFLAVLLLPLWMWLGWVLTPKKKLVVAIVDKTVTTRQVQEHISLDWVLRHEKYTKTRDALYQPDRDYFGFFPGTEDRFELKGLERFSPAKLAGLSEDADLVYFTDTYGVYSNEWYSKKLLTERSSLVYGGMTMQDVDLLSDMKTRHKLMIAEFNAIGSPTAEPVRGAFEKMFGMHWTGWTGRFFSDLDTNSNKELPHWLVNNYKAQHGGVWPFRRSGLVFVSSSDRVEILEEGVSMEDPVPAIVSTAKGQELLNVPEELRYPFWFDVVEPGANEVAAEFVAKVNTRGRTELRRYGIPERWPAVLMHRGADYGFYYFSGDFCDNPISDWTAYFRGVHYFSRLFYSSGDPAERAGFFWRFYRPMMTTILRDYYRSLPRR